MASTIVCISILVIWLAASIIFSVRKKFRAKKDGRPSCCCGCSECYCKKLNQSQKMG